LRAIACCVRAAIELLWKRPSTRQARADWLHRLCARLVRATGIEVEAVGEFPRSGAVISNHLSYTDIIVYASIAPCVFVSKSEVEGWPVFGWMTTMAGTVYVARGQGGSAERARDGISTALNEGLPVMFFPEGTTTNGSHMLKFRSGLLAQVLAESAPVTAACINYSLREENGPSVTVADDVCYWDDGNMWLHIVRFLGLRGVRAEVRFADAAIPFLDPNDRKLAAEEARSAVGALRTAALKQAVPESARVSVT